MTDRPPRASYAAACATALLCVACAAPHVAVTAGPAEPKLLTAEQGLVVVQEALMQAGVLAERGFLVMLDRKPFQADVRFGTPPFAIEWLSAEERAKIGDLLPQATPKSPLQIAWCMNLGTPVQMLVLDAATYPYEGNPLLVQRGAHAIEDAEKRVRHDVADFLAYVRDQGGQL